MEGFIHQFVHPLYVVDDSCVTITVSKYCTKYEEPGKQLLILYGTEYGFSEEVAKKVNY